MKSITIFPDSMEAIGQALDLFGEKRVGTCAWNEPIRVNGVTEDEVAYAMKFFSDMGCEVKEEQEGGNN